MSYETTIMLAPAPGAPGEFLATVSADEGEDLPFEIIIDNYTRDSWGLAHSITIEDSGIKWQVLQIRSIDGRNKLPGERAATESNNRTSVVDTYLTTNYCVTTLLFFSTRVLPLLERPEKVRIWNICITRWDI
jgi:hypothetical protein